MATDMVFADYARALGERGGGPRPSETTQGWAERRYGHRFVADLAHPGAGANAS
jgi:hypothetical protein